jgi:hypothetical protein
MKLGIVELFGHTGLDEKKIRAAVTLKQGDDLSLEKWPATMQAVSQTVSAAAGVKVTDVALVGFDEKGRLMVFIGLAGPTARERTLRDAPASKISLPGAGLQLYKDLEARLIPALRSGNAAEDYSQGFSLFADPEMRAIQLKMRDYALQNDSNIRSVLIGSSDAEQRRASSQLMGYARHTKIQIGTLLVATTDPDEIVRNNAVRALGVIAKSDPDMRKTIPAGPFVHMVRSGTWTDRNKGAMLLEELTATRDPELLKQIKAEAVPSLLEMARWQSKGHRDPARRILGRVGGLEETRIMELLGSGDLQPIVKSLGKL